MKNTILSILSLLIIPLVVKGQVPPAVRDNISDFNQRLQSIYQQSDYKTSSHQIVFGSVEAITAYKLGNFISKRDEKAIRAVNEEINGIRYPETNGPISSQYAESLTDAQRAEKLKVLNKRLKSLEGNIVTKGGRGLTRVLVRGTQLFLIFDLGTRIYVLSALQDRDPDILPAGTLACSQLDCEAAINQAIYLQSEAYKEARERLGR